MLLAALFFFMLTAAADAYTLVLRSGRHVTIPDDFKVTPSAVVYEASPGFFVTVWLANLDVAATETANAEPAGSFAKRIKQGPDAKASAPTTPAARAERRAPARVITNRDLEPLRLKREAQEAEYERTRRERGMPSKQELQRRVEEQDRRLRELTEELRAERQEAELESVRSELINVRRSLNELSSQPTRRTETYVNEYAYPDYYPYYQAPPVLFINPFPFARRGFFGRGDFGPHGHARRWPYSPWQGGPFNPLAGPTVNGSTPLVMAPAPSMPRR